MAISSRRSSGPVLRSHSPPAVIHSSPSARSESPTSLNIYGRTTSPLRFSMDRSSSPRRSISASAINQVMNQNPLTSEKRTCTCSPTNHPGSFRCSFHKKQENKTTSYPSNRLNARRSAMANSLVRIGTVEGDLVKRALAALIRPSSHHQKRRSTYKPRPSRLSVMSKAQVRLSF